MAKKKGSESKENKKEEQKKIPITFKPQFSAASHKTVNLKRRTYLAQLNKDKYYYKLSKSICFCILPLMQHSGNHVKFQDSLERCTG